MISTFDKKSKPFGWTLTYLDSEKTRVKYSFFDKYGKEKVYYTGYPLEFVEEMKLVNDYNAGELGYHRKDIRFTGLIRNGVPFIGTLTYKTGR